MKCYTNILKYFTIFSCIICLTNNTHQVGKIRQVNNDAASGGTVVKIVVPIAVVKIVIVIGVVFILLLVRFVLLVVRMIINLFAIKLDEGTVGRARALVAKSWLRLRFSAGC